jgi:toxin ParE1/3/4
MKVRYTRRAQSDLLEIAAYISAEDVGAAKRVARVVQHAIDLLARRPQIGIRNERSPGLLSKLANPYPYRIHYRIRGDILLVVHIRHTSRREWRGG